MSFVLSVVCIEPTAPIVLPIGPLIIQEADQQPNTACYLPALTRYFNRPIQGTGYYVFVDIGERYPSSAPFFPWPDDDSEPVRLRMEGIHRCEFTKLLHYLVTRSRVRRVLVLCELNGSVTWSDPTPEELAELHVQIKGTVTIREFWGLIDQGEIIESSITIIQEDEAKVSDRQNGRRGRSHHSDHPDSDS